jgi:hypothetical protein
MLGALEDRYRTRNRHRIAWKYDIEIERRAVDLPAGQAVAHTNAIGVAARLEPHFATGAAAFMDAVCHEGRVTRYTSLD